jgi:hypothetical protein
VQRSRDFRILAALVGPLRELAIPSTGAHAVCAMTEPLPVAIKSEGRMGTTPLSDDSAPYDLADRPAKKKQKRNKPTLSCAECVERKTKVCLSQVSDCAVHVLVVGAVTQ